MVFRVAIQISLVIPTRGPRDANARYRYLDSPGGIVVQAASRGKKKPPGLEGPGGDRFRRLVSLRPCGRSVYQPGGMVAVGSSVTASTCRPVAALPTLSSV